MVGKNPKSIGKPNNPIIVRLIIQCLKVAEAFFKSNKVLPDSHKISVDLIVRLIKNSIGGDFEGEYFRCHISGIRLGIT